MSNEYPNHLKPKVFLNLLQAGVKETLNSNIVQYKELKDGTKFLFYGDSVIYKGKNSIIIEDILETIIKEHLKELSNNVRLESFINNLSSKFSDI